MDYQPVEITRSLRRMCGGSQSHLVEGDDGCFYVAKFLGNPQGNRTLINEWFAHLLFRQLGVATPSLRVLRLTPALSKDLAFQVGGTRVTIEPGLHLGSQYPVNPAQHTVFDFLPMPFLCRITNLNDFAKALVLDQFLAQADTRQAIFVREWTGPGAWRFRAYMIDNGWTLGGTSWELQLRPSPSLCWNRAVYTMINMQAECAQALQQIVALRPDDLCRFGQNIPRVWFSKGDEAAWAKVMDQLEIRRNQLPQLLMEQMKTGNLDFRERLSISSDVQSVCSKNSLLE